VEYVSSAIRRVTEKGYKFTDSLDEHEPKGEQLVADSRLSEEARTLLIAVANDAHGDILETTTFDGYDLLANHRSFVTDRNPRTESRWRGALDELLEHKLIDPKQGDVYKITKMGFEVADTLVQASVE
jgi:hypothetical protein